MSEIITFPTNSQFSDVDRAESAARSVSTERSEGGDGRAAVDAGFISGELGVGGPAFLGINARTAVSRATPGFQRFDTPSDLLEKVDPETGEFTLYRSTDKGDKVYKTSQEARAERYALKSVVNHIFPFDRVAKCCRCRRDKDGVTIQKSKHHGRAYFGGLVSCASVWACPVCAAKIAERRRTELVSASSSAEMMGYKVLLATFTVPHGLGDDVKDILKRMVAAWRFMTMSSAYKKSKPLMGVLGTIRAMEVTYGLNGFHPHFHVLFFCETDNAAAAAFAELILGCLWRNACVKRGLPEPSREHGVKVDDGQWAARYMSKWGLEDEMTKAHLKTSRGIKGMSPWDMLRDVLANGFDVSSRSRRLFAVYANAFKGQRQLYWSNGLRDLLGLEEKEKTDEEIAAEQDDDAFELAKITTEQWRAILYTRSEAAILDMAERDSDHLQSFMACLVAISQHSIRPLIDYPDPQLD